MDKSQLLQYMIVRCSTYYYSETFFMRGRMFRLRLSKQQHCRTDLRGLPISQEVLPLCCECFPTRDPPPRQEPIARPALIMYFHLFSIHAFFCSPFRPSSLVQKSFFLKKKAYNDCIEACRLSCSYVSWTIIEEDLRVNVWI